ncbi:MAG: DUF5666 domain-containing protein [Acidobacteriia bacterium]|nr:DUF5666 domain-containing protein [Terriglobia bacterium]
MKRFVVGTMLVALVLLTSSAILSAQEGGQRPAFDPNKMTGGEIKSIDATALTFAVERVNRRTGETTQDTIYCNDKTAFEKDGAAAKFADFKVGDRVRASGDRKDGKFWAEKVSTMQMRAPRQ